MGGDDSQKLRPWRGTYSSPGRSKPPAHSKINCNGKLRWGSRGATFPGKAGSWLSYRLHGSFLESRPGSLLASAEGGKMRFF